jgi:hypothetical protein
MLYPDLTINQKINAKGNSLVLYRRLNYRNVRRKDGDTLSSDVLLIANHQSVRVHEGPIEVRY